MLQLKNINFYESKLIYNHSFLAKAKLELKVFAIT